MDDEPDADEADFDDDLAVIDDSPLCEPAFTYTDNGDQIVPF